MAEFLPAYRKTGGFEGGWANVKGDSGLATYCGIASASYPNWVGFKLLEKYQPLKHGQIVKDHEIEGEVKALYKREFWDRVKGDQIDDQELAEKIYDRAVNFGVKEAVKQTQIALGIEPTGKMDEYTLNAINNPDKYLLS